MNVENERQPLVTRNMAEKLPNMKRGKQGNKQNI